MYLEASGSTQIVPEVTVGIEIKNRDVAAFSGREHSARPRVAAIEDALFERIVDVRGIFRTEHDRGAGLTNVGLDVVMKAGRGHRNDFSAGRILHVVACNPVIDARRD